MPDGGLKEDLRLATAMPGRSPASRSARRIRSRLDLSAPGWPGPRFDIARITERSAFEPACGLDGEVVKHLAPPGWVPPILPTVEVGRHRMESWQSHTKPCGHWSVWTRVEDGTDRPQGFGFLSLAGEMSAVYPGLHCRLGRTPLFDDILRPGCIGFEWESVPSPETIARRVAPLPAADAMTLAGS